MANDFLFQNGFSNQTLSELRAAAVANYLIDNGIDPARIQYKGFGGRKPMASNDTEVGRSQNRRVELMIIEAER